MQFPKLAQDIKIPKLYPEDRFFSSVFRISSSNGQLWTHYDVSIHNALPGSLSNDDGNSNENGKKAIGLDWQNNNYAYMHHAFLYISLLSLHNYDVKLPNFTFCRGHDHNATTVFLVQAFKIIQLLKNLPRFDKLNKME